VSLRLVVTLELRGELLENGARTGRTWHRVHTYGTTRTHSVTDQVRCRIPSRKDRTPERGRTKGRKTTGGCFPGTTAGFHRRRPGPTGHGPTGYVEAGHGPTGPRLREELVSLAHEIIAILGDDDVQPAIGRPRFDPMGPRVRSRPMMGRGRRHHQHLLGPLVGDRAGRPGARRPGPPGRRATNRGRHLVRVAASCPTARQQPDYRHSRRRPAGSGWASPAVSMHGPDQCGSQLTTRNTKMIASKNRRRRRSGPPPAGPARPPGVLFIRPPVPATARSWSTTHFTCDIGVPVCEGAAPPIPAQEHRSSTAPHSPTWTPLHGLGKRATLL
jgi:hypothetical protein